jgi:DHA1 family inner membrane transport protein
MVPLPEMSRNERIRNQISNFHYQSPQVQARACIMPAMHNDLSSRRWLILASTVVSFFSVGVTFFAVPPLIPELLSKFAVGHLAIGVLMGAISVPAILFSIPLGAAIDRWPARATGNVALGLMAIGAVLFALAPSYAVLVAGRLLFGVGGLAINLLLARLVSTAFAGRELALAMGLFNAVYPASMITMFTLHAKLLAEFGWRGELMTLAIVVILAIPLHNLAVPRGLRGEAATMDQRRVPWLSTPLVALAISWMLFFAAYASIFTFAPEWAGGGSGALLKVSLIPWVAIFLAPITGTLIDRTGRAARWVLAGHVILAFVLAGMALRWLPAAPAMLLVGVTFATIATATYALPAVLVCAARVGFAFGFITAFSNLGNLAGPAIAGGIHDRTGGWSLVWILLAAGATLGAVAALVVEIRGNRAAGPLE